MRRAISPSAHGGGGGNVRRLGMLAGPDELARGCTAGWGKLAKRKLAARRGKRKPSDDGKEAAAVMVVTN